MLHKINHWRGIFDCNYKSVCFIKSYSLLASILTKWPTHLIQQMVSQIPYNYVTCVYAEQTTTEHIHRYDATVL